MKTKKQIDDEIRAKRTEPLSAERLKAIRELEKEKRKAIEKRLGVKKDSDETD